MGQEEPWKERLLDYFLAVLVSTVAGTLIHFGFEIFLTILWPRLKALLHFGWLTFVGTTVVLLIGVGLYFFKKHYQKVYGLAEVGFALAVGWASILRVQSTGDGVSWTTVVAAAYLVVRGITNYVEGRKQTATI